MIPFAGGTLEARRWRTFENLTWLHETGSSQDIARELIDVYFGEDQRFPASVIVAGGVILARYLQLDRAADVLGNAASLAAPVMLVGACVLLLGRWIYGDWNDRSPVVHAIAFFIRSAGTFVAVGLGAMRTRTGSSGM